MHPQKFVKWQFNGPRSMTWLKRSTLVPVTTESSCQGIDTQNKKFTKIMLIDCPHPQAMQCNHPLCL